MNLMVLIWLGGTMSEDAGITWYRCLQPCWVFHDEEYSC